MPERAGQQGESVGRWARPSRTVLTPERPCSLWPHRRAGGRRRVRRAPWSRRPLMTVRIFCPCRPDGGPAHVVARCPGPRPRTQICRLVLISVAALGALLPAGPSWVNWRRRPKAAHRRFPHRSSPSPPDVVRSGRGARDGISSTTRSTSSSRSASGRSANTRTTAEGNERRSSTAS